MPKGCWQIWEYRGARGRERQRFHNEAFQENYLACILDLAWGADSRPPAGYG